MCIRGCSKLLCLRRIRWRHVGVPVAMALVFAVLGAVFALAPPRGAVAEVKVGIRGAVDNIPPPPMDAVLALARTREAAAAGLVELGRRPIADRRALYAPLPGPWARARRLLRRLGPGAEPPKPVTAFMKRTWAQPGPGDQEVVFFAHGPDPSSAKALADAAARGFGRFLTTPRTTPPDSGAVSGAREPEPAHASRVAGLAGQIEQLEAYLAKPGGPPPVDTGSEALEAAVRRLNALLADRARLSIDFGPKHPDVRENEAQIRQAQAEVRAGANALLTAKRATYAALKASMAGRFGADGATLAGALSIARIDVGEPIRLPRQVFSGNDALFVAICGALGLLLGVAIVLCTGGSAGAPASAASGTDGEPSRACLK